MARGIATAPSRRDVIKSGGRLAAVAAIGAAAIAAAGVVPLHPDAELLASFERWWAPEDSLTASLSKTLLADVFSAACG